MSEQNYNTPLPLNESGEARIVRFYPPGGWVWASEQTMRWGPWVATRIDGPHEDWEVLNQETGEQFRHPKKEAFRLVWERMPSEGL